jgi:tetratricopeptide (TPR) repeat protein
MPAAAHPVVGSREIRLFISSTFLDLQAEREHLMKKVFTELRRLCRERGVQFTEIDLRWGITQEEASQGKVLKICLNEITKCRPYFLAVLGERYGWTPELKDVGSAPELFREFPWVKADLADGMSVTEIEIRHGALNNPAAAGDAMFYLHKLAASAPAPDRRDIKQSAPVRLTALKEEIRRSGLRVRDFSGPEDFGSQVRADLLALLDRRFPADQAPSPPELERRAHEAFAATRDDAYVANEPDLSRLDRHAVGAGPPLIVLGESGAGKSALLAHWSARFRRSHPVAFVITHYLGAGPSGTDHLGLIRRVIAEIREHYAFDEEVPGTPEQLETDFPRWLARVGDGRLVLVIDAIDRLVGQAANLAWLPDEIPSSVRVILSSLAGPALEALRRRKPRMPEMVVQPLNPPERAALVDHFLGEYGKALSPAQRARVIDHPRCGNPLFLRTVLDELRLFGVFDELDRYITHFLEAPDLEDLFRRVLERMGHDYGESLVRAVLIPIWAARRGLSENELLAYTCRTRLDLSTLLWALDFHLFSREGLLGFAHDELARAVARRYLEGASARALAHRDLAGYFETQPTTLRRADELPWQLQESSEWVRLKDCLADPSTFEILSRDETRYELLGYWRALGERYDPVTVYEESLRRLEAENPAVGDRLHMISAVATFVALIGSHRALKAAEALYRRGLDLAGRIGNPKRVYPDLVMPLEIVLRRLGRVDEAERLSDQALGFDSPADAKNTIKGGYRAMVGETQTPEELQSAVTLASALRALADVKPPVPAEPAGSGPGNQSRGTDIRGFQGFLQSPSASTLRGRLLLNEGILLARQGHAAKAEPSIRKALAAFERENGPDDPDTADCHHQLGLVLGDQGRYREAESSLRRALDIQLQKLGPSHPDTALTMNDLGGLMALHAFKGLTPSSSRRQSLDEAESLMRKALEALEQAKGRDHQDASTARRQLEKLVQLRSASRKSVFGFLAQDMHQSLKEFLAFFASKSVIAIALATVLSFWAAGVNFAYLAVVLPITLIIYIGVMFIYELISR